MATLAAGLLGGLGSAAAGIFGASAADTAAQVNWQINLLNYYQRERERAEAMRIANQARHDNQLGATDAKGNRTHFVQGVGWVTDVAPQQKQLGDLQDAEQKAVLTHDLPLRRQGMDRNYRRSLSEEALADTFRRQLKDVRRGDDRAYEDALYRAQTHGINDAADQSASVALRRALRTDNSNIDRIVEGVTRAQTDALAKAGLDAKVRSMGMADEQYNKDMSGTAALYNLFAGRAQALPDVSYKPQAPGSQADTNTGNFAKQQGSLDTVAAQFAGQKGGSLDYIQPNYGWANALGGGASALASALRVGGVSGFGNSGGVSSRVKDTDRFVGEER